VIPRIKVVRGELLQWIVSSDRAAWRGRPLQTAVDLIHEMGHHALHVMGFQPTAHMDYDEWWKKRFKGL